MIIYLVTIVYDLYKNWWFTTDKSLIVWQLTRGEAQYGLPNKRLCGHSHFVSDVVISSDGQFALSGSWDGDLRLWNLNALVFFYFKISDLYYIISVSSQNMVNFKLLWDIKITKSLSVLYYSFPYLCLQELIYLL